MCHTNLNPREARFPLWSLLWRVLILGPILMPLGLVMFCALVVSIFAPPGYAVILAMGGDYFWCVLLLVLWFLWLSPAKRLFQWMMQGVEDSSL